MFTGIVQAVGTIERVDEIPEGRRFEIGCPLLEPASWNIGDSIAVSGGCLTAVALSTHGFAVDLSAETLAKTRLGELEAGSRVNLEPALKMSDRLGGHFVTGHVDGLAELVSSRPSGDSRIDRYRVPAHLSRFIASKGSVTLDGVSLTVNAVDASEFEINLIPHTLKVTTLGALKPGDRVNLEIDLLARYLDRLQGEQR